MAASSNFVSQIILMREDVFSEPKWPGEKLFFYAAYASDKVYGRGY